MTKVKNFAGSVWKKILKRKGLSIIIIIVVSAGYYAYGKLNPETAETKYVLAAARKGTIVQTVSGTGQVSVSNQVDVKPETSGNIIHVSVKEGDHVRAGAIIAGIDPRDAQKSVRDAEANLESARIALEKIKKPADALSLIQAENAVTVALESKQDAEDSLVKDYDDGFNTVANAFIDLPGVVTGLSGVLNGKDINTSQPNADSYYDLIKTYKPNAADAQKSALSSYESARTAYDKNIENYKSASRYSDRAEIDSLITETYDTGKLISEAVKNSKSFLDLVNDVFTAGYTNSRAPAVFATHQSTVEAYIGTTNSHLGSLLTIKNSIKNDKDAIVSADRTIIEENEALVKLKAGADPLDVKSQELAVKQRENALEDAKENLSKYSVRVPFEGIAAKVVAKKGDSASSGAAIATIITDQRIAQISQNEVDVAKVKIGAKATLTFDAFPELAITGVVAQIDSLGTVSQGVVNYNVQIAFDTQDARVKPGMTVSAAIITDVRQDVLMIPGTAVKSQDNSSYVETLNEAPIDAQSNEGITSKTAPKRQAVEIGISNDTMTEVTSGLSEGDLVVSRTISGTSQTQSSSQNSGLRLPGIDGGAMRAGR